MRRAGNRKILDRGKGGAPVGRPRLGREPAHPFARVRCAQQFADSDGLVRRGARRRQHPHRPSASLRPVDQPFHRGLSRRPVGGRRPAVVDDQNQRPRSVQGGPRVPYRMGETDKDQQCEQHAQQDQPQRRTRRRFLLRPQRQQQANRREIQQPGRRRRDAKQPPQHRQRRGRGQEPRGGKSKGAELQHFLNHRFRQRAVQRQQRGFGWPVGAVDGETPPDRAR